jgi:hypothetical protein
VTELVDTSGGALSGSDRPVWRYVVRWWWIIVLGGIAGATVGLVTASDVPVVYEARSIVFASESSIPAEDFENLGTSAFATDTVIQPVITELGLDVSVEELLSSNQLQGAPIRDTTAVRVIGRASDPRLAADLVNTAAESFANTATFNGMGNFSQFGDAAVPDRPLSAPTRLYVLVGGVAGGAAVALLLLVLYFFYEPTLTEEGARDAFGADGSFTGRVRVPLTNILRKSDKSRAVKVRPLGLLPALQAALDTNGSPDVSRVCLVALESRGGRGGRATVLMNQLIAQQQNGAPQPTSAGDVVGDSHASSPPAMQATGVRFMASLKRSDVVVAFVSEGASLKRVRDLRDEVRITPEVKRRIVVFVRRASRRSLVVDNRRGSVADQVSLLRRPQLRGSSRRQARNT